MENIEVAEIPGKGRGMISKKDFKTGQLIVKEDAYVYTVMNSQAHQTCHFCLATNSFDTNAPPMMKCSACSHARYCDRDCQKLAWREHKLECKSIRCVAPGIPADKTKMVARILWKRLRGEREEGLIKLEQLDAHLKERSTEDQKDLDDHVYDFGDYYGYDDLPENDEQLRHLFSVIDCNAIGINDRRGIQSIAIGIYPTCAMINHSCDPNTVAVSNGKRLEVRALRNISAGDEITITYVSSLLTKDERLEKLKSQYYFDCDCKVCTGDCEADKLKLSMISPDIKPHSEKYIVDFSKNVMKRIELSKKKEDWERMSNQVNGALMQQDAVMADTHVLKMAVLNLGVEVHSFLQRQTVACEQGVRLKEAYEKLLPPIHPVLGLYLMRLGILQWQTEQLNESLVNLKAAANIITKTHGESHVIFTDLLGLIQQVQMETKLPRNARVNARIAKVRAGHKLPQAF